MPQHNYDEPFVVTGEPYDYGLPGSVYVDMHPSAPEEPEEEDRDETPPQTPALEPAPGD
jgi:hypothetical protein